MSTPSGGAAHRPIVSLPRQWLVLAGLVIACFTVAALGSLATTTNVDGWYAEANQPWFTPPNAVFGPVWTVLYAAMAVAAWLAWREGAALTTWWVQLGLNLAWTPVFFAAQQLWLGLVVIVALDVAVLLVILRFRRHSTTAALLLVPYLAWVLYATALTAGIAWLN